MKIKLIALVTLFIAMSSIPTFANNIFYSKNKKDISAVWNIEGNGEFTKVHRAKSVMKRFDDKICATAKVRNLSEGAYTAWWVIFNNPEYCSDGIPMLDARCGVQDFSNVGVDVTGMWVAGALVGPKGKAVVDICLDVGELTHELMPFGTQAGLTNPKGAEIHFILRNHGPAAFDDAEALGQQLNSYGGGCELPDAGIEGFPCFEEKTIIHKKQ